MNIKKAFILTVVSLGSMIYAGGGAFTQEELFNAINSKDVGGALDIIGSRQVPLNVTDENGNTALHRAAWYLPDNPQLAVVIERLLSEGADQSIVNNAGQSPLEMALSKQNIDGKRSADVYSVRWLRVRLANPHARVLQDAQGTVIVRPDKAIVQMNG